MLFGDSLLGRFTKRRITLLEWALGPGTTVYNCAAGGWNSVDGARRATGLSALAPDVVVLSFGMNDCAPWMRIPLGRFVSSLDDIARAFPDSRLVAFLPPRVREHDRPGLGRRANAELDRYRDALRRSVGPRASLDVVDLLEGAEFATLEDDGVHLSDESYAVLVPALGRLVARVLSPRGRVS